MTADAVRGIEAAIFGAVDGAAVRDWLGRFVRAGTGVDLTEVLTTAGDIGAVWMVRLHDGRELVVKAFRPGARLSRLNLIADVQNGLVDNGFPCPEVVIRPIEFDGVVATAEVLRRVRNTLTDAHDPRVAPVMAAGLRRQIELSVNWDGSDLVVGRPAWADWSGDPWPVPHDPIFVFDRLPAEHAWLERTAADALSRLAGAADRPAVVGHSDWVFQNVAVTPDGLAAAWDWDSLVYAPESTIAGMAAGAYTQGSSVAPDIPTAQQVETFIDEYQMARPDPFDPVDLDLARAAARWVRCYNARCTLDNLVRRGMAPPAGSSLEQLRNELAGEDP